MLWLRTKETSEYSAVIMGSLRARMNVTVEYLNQDVSCILTWCITNCLKINPSKSQAILLGTTRPLKSFDYANLYSVKIGNSVVAPSG
ncbi:hypothetical protein PR048_004652, partial [Dryococelus australis]